MADPYVLGKTVSGEDGSGATLSSQVGLSARESWKPKTGQGSMCGCIVSIRPRVTVWDDWAWGNVSGFELSAGPSEQYGCSCLTICRDYRVQDKNQGHVHTYLTGRNEAKVQTAVLVARDKTLTSYACTLKMLMKAGE
jgi:hypothetical protein